MIFKQYRVKKTKKRLAKLICMAYFTLFFSLYLTTYASAYLDPATTAMVIQVVAGVFITLGVMFGIFRRKVIMFFKNISVKRIQRKVEKEHRNKASEK